MGSGVASEDAGGNAWGEVLRHRPFWTWSAVALIVRMPPFMTALGFVAATIGTRDSERIGGLMVTAYVVANLVAPLNGRIHDRFGPSRSLPVQLLLGGLALALLTLVVGVRAPAIVLVLCAGLCGLITAGMSGALRATLTAFIPAGRIRRALAVDAFFVEMAVVIAPLVVIVATIRYAWGGIAVMSAFIVLGAAGARWLHVLARQRASVARLNGNAPVVPASNDASRSLWSNSEFIFWILVSVAFGHVLGTLETGALPIAIDYSRSNLSGVLLIAVAALLSILCGIGYATRAERFRLSEASQALIMLAAMGIGCIGLAIPDAWPVVLIAAAVIGACTAPINIIRQTATERTVAPERKAEAFGTLFAANGIGFGFAGLALATMPLGWMLASGGATSLIALAYGLLAVRTSPADGLAVDPTAPSP